MMDESDTDTIEKRNRFNVQVPKIKEINILIKKVIDIKELRINKMTKKILIRIISMKN